MSTSLSYERHTTNSRVVHHLNSAWHGHGSTHGIPWHPHGISWCGIGFHGTSWGVPWHATGGIMATPSATAMALRGNPTECHGNSHGTLMFTAPRLGLGVGFGLGLGFHGMPWMSVKGSMVCRGRCCLRGCHGVPRQVVKKDNNVLPKLLLRIIGFQHQ